MSDSFKRTDKIEYDSLKQDPIHPVEEENKPLVQEFEGEEPVQSSASMIIDEYDRTIEFQKFIEGLIRERSKVEVEIDPNDDPEVWMAMLRVFKRNSSKMNQESYFQVVDALEVIERIEQVEDSPREDAKENFLSDLPDTQEVNEGEITDPEFQISAIDEIADKSKVQRASVFKDPPAPEPPEEPPKSLSWLRRWRKINHIVVVLDKSYRVQWLRDRWWRKK